MRAAEAQIESSTVEPDCLVPIVKLNSDVLETEPLNLLIEATNVDCLLTALPVGYSLHFMAFSTVVLLSLIF